MTGYKLPMEVEATIQHQAGEIMRLKAERDELVAWIDGVIEILELYRPETPSQKDWQRKMVANGYRLIQNYVDSKLGADKGEVG